MPPTAAPDRGGERRTYRIPRPSSPSTKRARRDRGILGAIGKKVLKVLVFPLVDPILGKVGDHFAKRWEAKNRLNRVRWMTVDGYRSSVADPFADADWARRGPRARARARHLLHRPRRGSEGAPHHHDRAARGAAAASSRSTTTASPSRRRRTPSCSPGWCRTAPLEVDLVTHSRGGLVGREIAGMLSRTSPSPAW